MRKDSYGLVDGLVRTVDRKQVIAWLKGTDLIGTEKEPSVRALKVLVPMTLHKL